MTPARPTLLAALLAITTIGCASSSSGPSGPPANITIRPNAESLGHQAFAPDTFTVSLAADSTVTWRNADVGTPGDPYYGGGTPGVPHKLVADDSTFVADTTAPGANFSFKFTHAGSYPYHCAIHPTMLGLIVVTS